MTVRLSFPVRRACVETLAPDGDALGAWIVEEVRDLADGCDAVFAASATAGGREAVAFWADALERGARFANPRAFPWTLSSAPVGHLAMVMGITGPVVNLVGGVEAWDAAVEAAFDAVEDGIARRALVLGFDRRGEGASLQAIVVGGARPES